MAEEVREFKLPDLGEGLTEAEIVSWTVKEGEEVTLNQPIVEVETEKAIVEIPSPFGGVVEKLHGVVGDRIAVGAALISIRTSADAPKTGRRQEVLVGYGPEEGKGRRRRKKIGRREDEGAEEETAAPARALATPVVRKLAKDMGIEIDALAGSGPGGRVTREDVLAAAESPAAASGPATLTAVPALGPAASLAAPVDRRVAGTESEERIAVRSIRRSIAEKMVRSYTEIPHVTEWTTIDATELMRIRKELNGAPEAEGAKISPLPLTVRALVTALRKFPRVNSSWDAETHEIVIKQHIHVGIAADTDRGLLVPVVRFADQLNVFETSLEIARLVAAARDGSIAHAELTGSTITITNVGSFGMEAGTPIINYPEAAILCLGAISPRPWVVDGQIVPRQVMQIALTFDHRILDGAEAGRFLRYLGDLIESPARLLGLL